MGRNNYYAMDSEFLKNYISHKNNIQEGATLLTAEKIELIKSEAKDARTSEAPRNYSVADGIATIVIAGPLEPKADICALLFDIEMTTYSDIINSINLAENDSSVEKIVFEINSPGGNVVGLTRTAEKIKNAKKPTTAIITDQAASAAYWLASQANEIIAEHNSVEIGSIGVYCECINSTEADKMAGIVRKDFRSANAPLKNADPFTSEGEKQIVERITKLESVFFDYIASGRNTDVETVKENYGKGALLIAGEALEIGMIDAIETIAVKSTPTQDKNINTKIEDETMSEKIEMTQDQFDSAISKAASSAVQEALSTQATENETKLAAEKAESERKAGFNSLLASFPEQKQMINDEMEKGSAATSDFALKVSEAETTRTAVKTEVEKDQEDVAPETTHVESVNENTKLNSIANACVKGRI